MLRLLFYLPDTLNKNVKYFFSIVVAPDISLSYYSYDILLFILRKWSWSFKNTSLSLWPYEFLCRHTYWKDYDQIYHIQLISMHRVSSEWACLSQFTFFFFSLRQLTKMRWKFHILRISCIRSLFNIHY